VIIRILEKSCRISDSFFKICGDKETYADSISKNSCSVRILTPSCSAFASFPEGVALPLYLKRQADIRCQKIRGLHLQSPVAFSLFII
jgi:hypothetical protein